MAKEYPNPTETLAALELWKKCMEDLQEARRRINASVPVGLIEQESALVDNLELCRKKCREAAETHGGYKGEVGSCYYQKKEHIEYLVPRFKELYPEFAFCIDEVVNKAKVEALVKGKLIDTETLERATRRTPLTDAFILG